MSEFFEIERSLEWFWIITLINFDSLSEIANLYGLLIDTSFLKYSK